MDQYVSTIAFTAIIMTLIGPSTQYDINGFPVWDCHNFTGKYPLKPCHWNEGFYQWGQANLEGVPDPADKNVTEPETVLRVYYPLGSYEGLKGDAIGGAEFYGKPVTPAAHMVLEYQVYFSPNFRWSLGGKLPGLHGGKGWCTGRQSSHNSDCFSVRFLWTREGYGQLYLYNPMETDHWYCKNKDVSCNFDYGHTLGLKSFMFSIGTWQTIAVEVKLNQYDGRNGSIAMYYGSDLVYRIENIKLTHDQNFLIDKIFFSTYFGGEAGKSPQFSSEDHVFTYFRDFKVYTSSD